MAYKAFTVQAQPDCVTISRNARLHDSKGDETDSFIAMGLFMTREEARELASDLVLMTNYALLPGDDCVSVQIVLDRETAEVEAA